MNVRPDSGVWERLRRKAPRRPIRLTLRGGSVLVGGVGLVLLGIVLGLRDVVGIGAAGVLAVGGSAGWLSLRRLDRGRSALQVSRRIEPNPSVRGSRIHVTLSVAARQPNSTTRVRLDRLEIGEQADPELGCSGRQRAKITAEPDRISVRFPISPTRRGRWTLGPLATERTDLFGLVRVRQDLGGISTVAVWPRTVALPIGGSQVLGEAEPATVGARLSSTEDTTVRDYVPGDDPRRVHWVSAARHGQLMVRADESAGRSAVTVLLDSGLVPPTHQRDSDNDWAVECAASIALSCARAGHPVRIMATTKHPMATVNQYVMGHAGEDLDHILDQTLSIQRPATPADAQEAFLATAAVLRAHRRPNEILIGVLGGLRPVERAALGALGRNGIRLALVVDSPTDRRPASLEVTGALRNTGWRAVIIRNRSIPDAWQLLIDSAS